ncbi:MAG TPA: hypothetical protein VG899_11670 [Mycobacteriales bacterium]|nr:hypothetical protein [Mycobacteriales bacterium]
MCCFVLAAAAIAGGLALFGTGFVGPAPIALAAGGGLIVAGTSLWRPPSPGRQRYPDPRRDTR